MKRYNDEELHALQLASSDTRIGSTSALHAQNAIIIELLSRVLERGNRND